ncbi:hypothetical protein FRB96_003322 [Tulasnella sp. 330]|nr:hypothetical protein FRB96_003322 [Tulasnella sp. 330]KAG8880820.1 hypothetical protein FRB97_000411 [Tulasnella sp. 331]KAG8889983.1 hypothetical protein FRB98_001718 [Tulasnella sp. 332]
MSPLGSIVIVAAATFFVEKGFTNTAMESQTVSIQNPSLLPQECTWGEDDDFLNKSPDPRDILPAPAADIISTTTTEGPFSGVADQSFSFGVELSFHTILAVAETPTIAALVDTICDPADVSPDSLTPSPLSARPILRAWDDFATDDSLISSFDDVRFLSLLPVFSSVFDADCDEDEGDDVDVRDYFCGDAPLCSLPSCREVEPNDDSANLPGVLSLSRPPKFK